MAIKPYVPFDWPNVGSPLTPFVAIKFRGPSEFYYTFPDKQNRIYLSNANFNVLDDSGYSTAEVTLVDPDFYNLENIFIKALFLANSMVKGQGNWYCAMFWGWSYYGDSVGSGSTSGQRKTSGVHYYMLKEINYELTDVDLQVRLSLMDIGASLFSGDEVTTIGQLNVGDGVTHGVEGGATDGGEYRDEKLLERDASEFNANHTGGPLKAVASDGGTDLDFEIAGGGPSAAPTADGDGAVEPIQNVITGKSYWEIIKLICRAHDVVATERLPDGQSPATAPTDGPNPGDDGKTMSAPYGKVIIGSEDILTDVIDDLLTRIANQPEGSGEEAPTKRWGMLAGGKINPKPNDSLSTSPDLEIPFGWIPQPPKGAQSIEDSYRLARTFTYRPGYKSEIAVGETMINNLNYDWVSKTGALGIGLPAIYTTSTDENGEPRANLTLDDFANYNSEEVARIKTDPSIKSIPLSELSGRLGVKIEYNFDARSGSSETMELTSKAIIINVWNFFLREIVNVTVEIPGDPWLDNQIFNSDGSSSVSNYLVDLYGAYFKVKVYKLSPGSHQGSSVFLSEIISGNYLCMKGCSHSISAGEYTTTLQLMKAF